MLDGNIVATATQAITYTNTNTAYVGFKNITFDQIRVNAGTTEGLIDNVQFGATTNNSTLATPEPSQYAALAIGVLGLACLAFKARHRTLSH